MAGDWEEMGLPPANASDHQIRIEPGVVRTEFETAQPHQRRRHKASTHYVEVSITMDDAEIVKAIEFIEDQGHLSFEMPLATGLQSGVVTKHRVRLHNVYKVSTAGEGFWTMTLPLEVYLGGSETTVDRGCV